jgi:hypothetical protein
MDVLFYNESRNLHGARRHAELTDDAIWHDAARFA